MTQGPWARIRIGLGALATGFVISYFLYVLLRVIGAKQAWNMLSPVMMTLAMGGVAAGAMFHGRYARSRVRMWESAAFLALLVFFLCMAFNLNLSSSYLVPSNGFSLNTPRNLGLHLAGEVLFFVLFPLLFALPGYYFADCYHRASNPYWTYAIHMVGFLIGGPLGLLTVTRLGGPATGVFVGLVVLLMFLVRRRPIRAAVLLACGVGILTFSFFAPKLFFTWSQNDYEVLDSTWSPYYKLDFLSFDDGHCIAGVHNNVFLYYTCDTPAKAHLQVRQIFKSIATGKRQVLVIGGSLGTALSYITFFQDRLEHAVSVEVDPVVAGRSVDEYAHFSGFALNRPEVEVVTSEGRLFLDRDRRQFDLIFLDGLDNGLFFTPMSLVSIENYVFTREGMQSVFDRLSPTGVLTIDLGGFPAVDYVTPFLNAMPDEAHYSLFWYVVPDRPMMGLALFFIVASKDPAALKQAADHIRSLPSMVPVDTPPRDPTRAGTDDLPLIQMEFGPMGDFLTILVLLAGGAAALLVRRRRRRRNTPAPGFSEFAFALLGVVFVCAEFVVVMKNARLFEGPAYGMVLMTAVFTAGGVVSNLVFLWMRRQSTRVVLMVAALLSGVGLATLALVARGGVTAQQAAVLTLVLGICCGYFWPMLIHLYPKADRRSAYAIDALGCVAGGFLFNGQLLSHGFTHVAVMTGLLILFLLAWIVVRTRGVASR